MPPFASEGLLIRLTKFVGGAGKNTRVEDLPALFAAIIAERQDTPGLLNCPYITMRDVTTLAAEMESRRIIEQTVEEEKNANPRPSS